MMPSLYPKFDIQNSKLSDGDCFKACGFCKRAIQNKPQCLSHYRNLQFKPVGFYQCPFGFTSRTFYFEGQMQIFTGLIAFPRFDTAEERKMAKGNPELKVSRTDIDNLVKFFSDLDNLKADLIEKAGKIFPQAFHELRKLNAAVLQHAEKEIRDGRESNALKTILSAAELMRNNFDILEALSNIDTMKAVPIDDTINVYDLLYKTRCIFLEKAAERKLDLDVSGVRVIVRGSRKSFPIVPAVLLENAIKYGRPRTKILARVQIFEKQMLLIVENETDFPIDSATCFLKGSRFAGDSVEGGGFGLFLAKQIVIAHGGDISCEKIDARVKMTVKLPMVRVIPQT